MLVDFDICHRMVSLRKLYSVIVTCFLKVNILSVNISQMVRASAKMCESLVHILIFAIEWCHCENCTL